MRLKYVTNKIVHKIRNRILLKMYLKQNIQEILEIKLNSDLLEQRWSYRSANCYIFERSKSDLRENIDLSIIIPLYNSEKYIDSCMHGVLEQKTKYNYQIILVNDGSKDCTYAMVKEYEKSNPDKVLVINQSNKGISVARNAGLKMASGRYLAFVDHDDIVSENMVERLLETAYSQNADIVKAAYANVKNGKIKSIQEQSDIVIEGDMRDKLFDYRSYIFPGVYKKELFEHVQFPVGYWYEDMIIRTLIYRQSRKFVHISDVLYYKNFHERNASFVVWNLKNYKCLEQLYLVINMIEDNRKLGLVEDVWFYQCIMRELSGLLVQRTRELDSYTRQLTFLKACSILEELYREEYELMLSDENRLWQRVFANREYKLWQLLGGK